MAVSDLESREAQSEHRAALGGQGNAKGVLAGIKRAKKKRVGLLKGFGRDRDQTSLRR